MELRVWIDEGDLSQGIPEEEVLRKIAEDASEWYAKNYGGILETQLEEEYTVNINDI